jgi:hypothetical protein
VMNDSKAQLTIAGLLVTRSIASKGLINASSHTSYLPNF